VAYVALIGILIVVIVTADVFQSVVVPRRTPRTFKVSSLLTRTLWMPWRDISLRFKGQREYLLSIFAPLSLMLLLMVWVIALVVGFGLILYAMKGRVQPALEDLASAFYLAGTSLFTLGFGDYVAVGPARIVVLIAAGCGLSVMSLVITFLFSLYNSLQHREVFVDLVEARAGSPPSGVTLLKTYAHLKILDQLPTDLKEWEAWAAEIFESHRAYPILSFFRSTLEDDSWLGTLGAMLDACTLLLTVVETEHCGRAYLLHRMGCRIVLDLHRLLRLPTAEALEVDRQQFEQALQSLAEAGFVIREDKLAWREFVEVHSAYSSTLNALIRYFATTPPTWMSHPVPVPHPLRLRKQVASRGKTWQTWP
jgi:drug/metabolite transporter superfamily protein YnfA